MFEIIDKLESVSPTQGRFTHIADFFAIAFNVMFGIGFGLSIIGIILAGIRYVTSGSDIKATAQAKSALTYSIVAFLLVVGGYTIYRIILNMLRVSSEIPDQQLLPMPDRV